MSNTGRSRREPENLQRVLAEAFHVPLDHVAQALWKWKARRAIHVPAARRLVEDDPGLGELWCRISPTKNGFPSASLSHLACQLEPLLVEVMPSDSRHHLRHLIDTEAAQGDTLHAGEHPQVGQSTPVSGCSLPRSESRYVAISCRCPLAPPCAPGA